MTEKQREVIKDFISQEEEFISLQQAQAITKMILELHDMLKKLIEAADLNI